MTWYIACVVLTCSTVLVGCGRTAEEWYAEGKKYSDLVQHEKALPCYEKAIELDTSFVAAWYGKAEALHRLGRPGEALASVGRVIRIAPEPPSWFALKDLAREDAGSEFDRIFAEASYGRNWMDELRRVRCRRWREARPDSGLYFDATYLKGRILLTSYGPTVEARRCLEEALEAGYPDAEQLLRDWARQFRQQRN